MEQTPPERRRAPRVDCNMPVLLHGRGQALKALSSDISRVGTMLRVPIAEFGLPPSTSLADLGREAISALGDMVTVDLHHEVLGNLIQRTARPIRVGRAHPNQDYIEIGIDLLKPLTDMEVEFLGVPLPPLFHDVDVTWEPPATTESLGGESQEVTVVFRAPDEYRTPPLRVVPAQLDADGACANLGPVERLPLTVDGHGAADVLTALADVYGAEPNALIFVDAQPVWSGAARLQAVEVGAQDRHVRLQVGFPERLSAAVREKLCLQS
jgi:hypothetical protein